MHHRKKRSQGGPWSLDNIVHVCGHGTVGCHGWIEHNPNAAHFEGYHVRPWEEPSSIPIYQHHLGKFTHMNLLGANIIETLIYETHGPTADPERIESL